VTLYIVVYAPKCVAHVSARPTTAFPASVWSGSRRSAVMDVVVIWFVMLCRRGLIFNDTYRISDCTALLNSVNLVN
jgi:hypothetical protein